MVDRNLNSGWPDPREKLFAEADRLKIVTEGRSEQDIREAVRTAWLEENRAAIEAWNIWTEKNGLPLARYRAF